MYKYVLKNKLIDIDTGSTDYLILVVDTSFRMAKVYTIKRVTREFLIEEESKALNYAIITNKKTGEREILSDVKNLGRVSNNVVANLSREVKPLTHISIWQFIYERYSVLRFYQEKTRKLFSLLDIKITEDYTKLLYNSEVILNFAERTGKLKEGFRIVSPRDYFKRGESLTIQGKQFFYCDRGLTPNLYDINEFAVVKTEYIHKNYLSKLNQLKYMIKVIVEMSQNLHSELVSSIDYTYMSTSRREGVTRLLSLKYRDASEFDLKALIEEYTRMYIKKSLEYVCYLYHTGGVDNE